MNFSSYLYTMIMKKEEIKIRIEKAFELLEELDKAGVTAENAMTDFNPNEKTYPFGFGFMEAYVKSKVDLLKYILEDLK